MPVLKTSSNKEANLRYLYKKQVLASSDISLP